MLEKAATSGALPRSKASSSPRNGPGFIGVCSISSATLPEPEICESASTRYLPAPSKVAQIGTIADNAQKIALFRSLFRGREDTYAERWRTKDGTWAYRPAGKKNWLAVLASRPEDHKKVDR
jgi:hypothetical protein